MGSTFLCSIPIYLLLRKRQTKLNEACWTRALLLTATMGTLLLLPQLDRASGHGGVLLLVADCLIFPCVYIADGLCRSSARIVHHPVTALTSPWQPAQPSQSAAAAPIAAPTTAAATAC